MSVKRQLKSCRQEGKSMPKFCANLGFLFTEVPFLDRFAAAAKAGFAAVEFPIPYLYKPEQLSELLSKNRLMAVLINLPAGDWDAGERGIACLPDRVGEFQDGVGTGIAYSKSLGNKLINCLAGLTPEGVPQGKLFETLVGNLRFAAEELDRAGLTLVVEPINTYDIPTFFLNTSAVAMSAIDAANVPSMKLQYDIYHMQRMEGEISTTLQSLMPRIGHIQCAGVPGRTEPDRGEIDYAHVFGLIDKLGYDGWIGAEYKPVAKTEQGLGWLKAYT
jgi:hydroxypyruvate isomerase